MDEKGGVERGSFGSIALSDCVGSVGSTMSLARVLVNTVGSNSGVISTFPHGL